MIHIACISFIVKECKIPNASTTYICVVIIDLHHDVGRMSSEELWISMYVDLFEDQRLVPRWRQRVADVFGSLAPEQETHEGERIYVIQMLCTGSIEYWVTPNA